MTFVSQENIQANEKLNGASSAAELLLQRLERRHDWLKDLIKALLNRDIGLVDFGEKIEQKYGELGVMCPPRCTLYSPILF